MKPLITDATGYYDQAYIRFFFEDHPDLHLDVEIFSTVAECLFDTAVFSESILETTYILGHQ